MPNLTILTGAGISAESGIRTFRDSNGLWENHSVDVVATMSGFQDNPDLVNRFYDERRAQLAEVEPNAAHIALARLEAEWTGGGFLLITQNVDDLHERGGSKNICHMHGDLRKVMCSNPDCSLPPLSVPYVRGLGSYGSPTCPKCSFHIRPDVVWFGEMPKHLDEIEQVLDLTDIYVAIGTSGSVMPASLFPTVVSMNNRHAEIIEVNLAPTGESTFTKQFAGPASEQVPLLVEYLLNRFLK
jgi:NAD-dependent deacetylase